MAQGDAALTRGEAQRRRGGSWLSVGLDLAVMFGAAGLSALMIREAHRPGADACIGAEPFRGRVGRAVMLGGGLLFLDHFARILGLTALVASGLLNPPA